MYVMDTRTAVVPDNSITDKPHKTVIRSTRKIKFITSEMEISKNLSYYNQYSNACVLLFDLNLQCYMYHF